MLRSLDVSMRIEVRYLAPNKVIVEIEGLKCAHSGLEASNYTDDVRSGHTRSAHEKRGGIRSKSVE